MYESKFQSQSSSYFPARSFCAKEKVGCGSSLAHLLLPPLSPFSPSVISGLSVVEGE